MKINCFPTLTGEESTLHETIRSNGVVENCKLYKIYTHVFIHVHEVAAEHTCLIR